MWLHLSDAALMDALEGAPAEGTRRHLEGCGRCRARLAAAEGGRREALGTELPEPPGAYWEAFRRRVSRRIDAEGRRTRLPLRAWPALAAAAILVVLAVVPTPRGATGPGPAVEPRLPAWSALPPADEDGGLELLETVGIPDTALDGAALATSVASLDDDESRALAEALEAELGTGGQS